MAFPVCGMRACHECGKLMDKDTPVGLLCPSCGNMPWFIFDDGGQCWCGTNGCPVLIWDATKTLAENNAKSGFLDFGIEEL